MKRKAKKFKKLSLIEKLRAAADFARLIDFLMRMWEHIDGWSR